jgi:hypothetical protein
MKLHKLIKQNKKSTNWWLVMIFIQKSGAAHSWYTQDIVVHFWRLLVVGFPVKFFRGFNSESGVTLIDAPIRQIWQKDLALMPSAFQFHFYKEDSVDSTFTQSKSTGGGGGCRGYVPVVPNQDHSTRSHRDRHEPTLQQDDGRTYPKT